MGFSLSVSMFAQFLKSNVTEDGEAMCNRKRSTWKITMVIHNYIFDGNEYE